MWQGIHGHDAVAEHFCQVLAQGRLASSYLFLGPAGVGKRTFAEKLAQGLLCPDRESGKLDPCGNCKSCQLFATGSHPDLELVRLPDGKQRLPVELFIGDRNHRNQEGLCHNIALRALLGTRRVAIIDDADHFTTESSNSLLKTLEEPPRGALLILIGTNRSRQLPTILSRTQVVRFKPLPTEVIRELLLQQQIAPDEAQADLLAGASEGSLKKATDLADPELWEMQRRMLPQLTSGHLDSVRLAAELAAFVNLAGKEAHARRQRLRAVFRMVTAQSRAILRASGGVDPDSEERALAVLDRCLEAEVALDRNANQATLLECWLDDLSKILEVDTVANAQ